MKWCERNYLVLSVSKIKEMLTDFRKKQQDIATDYPMSINYSVCGERLSTYEDLGIVFEERLRCDLLKK